MKITAVQLAAHLSRDANAPWYLVSGDDPLLVQEACDLVRESARRRGYGERLVFDVERGFDWGAFVHEGRGLSLFAQRRLMELRLASNRPGDDGAKALQEYAADPPPDVVLLVVMPKLDSAVQKANWYRILERGGLVVQVWPVDRAQLPNWIMRRMRDCGMASTAEAAELLAERVEGNLLACAQEIEKMRLLYGDRSVDTQQVLDAVGDSARFDVFTLVDSALAGDGARCARILAGLRAEGVEPAVLVWALGREVRSMAIGGACWGRWRGSTGPSRARAREMFGTKCYNWHSKWRELRCSSGHERGHTAVYGGYRQKGATCIAPHGARRNRGEECGPRCHR